MALLSIFGQNPPPYYWRILASYFPCTHFRFRPLGCTCHPVYDGVRRGRRRRRRGFFLPSFLPTLFFPPPAGQSTPNQTCLTVHPSIDCKRNLFKIARKIKVQDQTMVFFCINIVLLEYLICLVGFLFLRIFLLSPSFSPNAFPARLFRSLFPTTPSPPLLRRQPNRLVRWRFAKWHLARRSPLGHRQESADLCRIRN